MSYEKLSLLKKSQIIEFTAQDLKKDYPEFNEKLFDRIKVFKSKDTLWVEFDMSFKLVPHQKEYYYKASKYYGKLSSLSLLPLKNPADYENNTETRFFAPDKIQQKQIEWIKNTIISSGIGLFHNKQLLEGYSIEAFEQSEDYLIVVESDSATGRFSIHKKTGKISQQAHKHKMQEKEKPALFQEIKD